MALKGHFENYTGKRFGRLIVVGNPRHNKHGNIIWDCVCDCGSKCVVLSSSLKWGRTRSCGCLKKELDCQRKAALKHGLFGTRIYGVWSGMVTRCYNSNDSKYKYYGKRGISMCKEWRESPEAFAKWAYANGYSEGLSIDRIDVNGNYEPSNCRWGNAFVQANNRRSNVFVEFDGERHTIAEWSRITGIKTSTIQRRLKKGWNAGEALGLEKHTIAFKGRPVYITGKLTNVTTACRELGIPQSMAKIISHRLSVGWSEKAAFIVKKHIKRVTAERMVMERGETL